MVVIEDFFLSFTCKESMQDGIPIMIVQCVVNDQVILSMFPQPFPLLMREVIKVSHGL